MSSVAQKLYTRVTNLSFAFVLALSSLTALAPFLFAQNASAATTVTNQAELEDAIDNGETVINLGSSFSVSSQVDIDQSLTLNGNGNTISPTFTATGGGNDTALAVVGGNATINDVIIEGAAASNVQGIQVWNSAATLNNVTSRNNDKAGIHVNNSTVIVNNVVTANNGSNFGGLMVSGGTLTINGQSVHAENTNWTGFKMDLYRTGGSIIDTNSQYSQVLSLFGYQIFNLKTAPVAPVIVSPAQNQVLTSTNVVIDWNTASYANSYNVDVNGSVTYGVSATELAATLSEGAHTVRVQSVAQSGLTGNWSALRTFSIDLPDTAAPTVSNISIVPTVNSNIGRGVTVYFDLDDETGVDFSQTRVLFADGPNTANQAKESAKFVPVHISGNSYKAEINTVAFLKQNYVGSYNLQFNLRDVLGNNRSTKPEAFRGILIDNSGPGSSLLTPASGSLVNGTQRFTFNTTDHTGVASGYVKFNGPTVRQYTLVQGAGNEWYADVDTTELTDGEYTIDARLVDVFGTARYGANKGTAIVDNTRPSVNLASPENDDVTQGNFTITGTASDANGVEKVLITVGKRTPGGTFAGYYLQDAEANWDGSTFTYNVTGLPEFDGTYYVRAIAYDFAGNLRSAGADRLVVDTTAPVAPTLGVTGLDSGDATNNVSIEATWNAPAGAVTYDYKYWNDISTSSYNSESSAWIAYGLTGNSRTGAFTEGEGTHYLQVRAIDAAGNPSDWSDTFTVIYDTTDPQVTVNPLTSSTATPTITGTATDDADGILEINFNGVDSTVLVDGLGNWSYTSAALANGTYTFTATATDAAGNDATASADVTVAVVTTTEDDPETPEDETETETQTIITPIIADPIDDGEGVQGATDENDDQGTQGANIEENFAQVDTDGSDGSIFGLAWYWWILILAGLAAIVWGIIAALRRRQQEA